MPIDLDRLKDESEKARTAVDNAITRLKDLDDDGLPLPDAADVSDQLIRAQADKAHLETLRAHLTAAGVVVKEIDASVESRLDKLAARLDDGIRNDFKVNAALSLVKTVLDAAEAVHDIAKKHSGKPSS
jgi:hypothetical protein